MISRRLFFATIALLGSSVPMYAGPQTRYLSDDPRSPYWELEKVQRKENRRCKSITFDELLPVIRTFGKKDGWEDPEVILKKVGVDVTALPTRCENVGGIFLLNRIIENLRPRAEELLQRKIEKIAWGTLETREIVSKAMDVGNKKFIIFDTRLFAFVYAMILIVDRTTEITSVNGQTKIGDFSETYFANTLTANGSLRDLFTSHLKAFLDGQEMPGIQFSTALEANVLMPQIDAIEMFLMGHEFGHVDEDKVGLSNWRKELVADRLGQQIIVSPVIEENESTIDDAFKELSAILYFELLEIYEDIRLCGATGKSGIDDLSEAQQKHFVAIAKNMLSGGSSELLEADKRLLDCRLGDHPPAWLRGRILQERFENRYSALSRFKEWEKVRYGQALIRNAQTLARLSRRELK